MRYRALDANGDYTFGQNGQNFLVNSPQAVGQAVLTRLKLWAGEWFLDNTLGVPWLTNVIGFGTSVTYDQVIRDTIAGTKGVSSIDTYTSSLDSVKRILTIAASITTIYGETQIIAPIVIQGGFGVGPYGRPTFGS